MPVHKLMKGMKKSRGSASIGRIGYRISSSRQLVSHEAGLDQLNINNDLNLGLVEYNFGTMETPFGYHF
jgi:hypothetical protein